MNASVLIASCDSYSDAWKPFFQLFSIYWKDCPFPVFLGSNSKSCMITDVSMINVGEDLAWADGIRKMLDSIPTQYVIFFLEDFFLCKAVPTIRVKLALQYMHDLNISCFKLDIRKNYKVPFSGITDLMQILPKDEYCINTNVSIWDKSTLYSLLDTGYSAWDFEVLNSQKAKVHNELPGNFVTFKDPVVIIKNGIWRGKWVPSTLRFLEILGLLLILLIDR